MEKPLHSQFMRKTVKVRSQKTFNCLKTGLLKKETGNANDYIRPSTENKQDKY